MDYKMDDIIFHPIGVIRTPHENAEGTPIQPAAASEYQGKIILLNEFVPGLQDLEGFSHIFVFYHFNRIKETKLVVKPFLDNEEHGIFATRAPARPCPMGMSLLKIESIVNNEITVSGVDILDNTPVIDIKPYIPKFDCVSDARFGWMEKRIERLDTSGDDGRFL